MQGIEELLVSGKFSDVILNVKGKKFRVHKNILAVHSQVFSSVMEHNNEEHANDTVNIYDSEPDIFADFLHFMYSGSTQNLNSENVVHLYTLADKYQVNDLNKACVAFMMNHISLVTFADIMALAIRYHEYNLYEAATQYFLGKSTDIAQTANWLRFLKENPAAGNDLFLKALALKYSKP